MLHRASEAGAKGKKSATPRSILVPAGEGAAAKSERKVNVGVKGKTPTLVGIAPVDTLPEPELEPEPQ